LYFPQGAFRRSANPLPATQPLGAVVLRGVRLPILW
jgi:hypothetical protein